MFSDIETILYERAVIDERVKELAAQVAAVYRNNPLVVAVTLKGAFIFAADLVRHLPETVEIVFLRSQSYGASTAPEREPVVELPPEFNWQGRHVLLVEDIVDTGRTVAALQNRIRNFGAASVRVCSFLDKPKRREVPVDVEFTGFTLQGDPFVVGYGLDFAERYRNLPFVGVLRQAGTQVETNPEPNAEANAETSVETDAESD
ncbi:MAG: hypoxanthine phosphoribosyltransferase [Planctomycetes bacterium]|nr:hypoxanthine phosphoribosyltransferase [Planctomycetota bacterium]